MIYVDKYYEYAIAGSRIRTCAMIHEIGYRHVPGRRPGRRSLRSPSYRTIPARLRVVQLAQANTQNHVYPANHDIMISASTSLPVLRDRNAR
jgi:hypothetical protein